MKKILIGDDHPAIRNGVKLILESEFNEVDFGEASTAMEISNMIRKNKWDILILDMDMPGRSGLDLLRQLKDEGDKTPVLVFSMYREEQIAVRVIKLGAFGYLSKDAPSSELVTAVKVILSGKKYITPGVAQHLASLVATPADKELHQLLSDREYQTMILLASGKTVSQIADELALSVATVSTYRSRILEKMNLKNNAELTFYAFSTGLV